MAGRQSSSKLLFIINAGSGNDETDCGKLIEEHFATRPEVVEIYQLPEKIDRDAVVRKIKEVKPDRVIAAGGDGTVKLVATCLMDSEIPLGILPTGSANGMAKELAVPEKIEEALALVTAGKVVKIHLVKINEEICIHLADLGFNAYLVKRFDALEERGMWGYARATFHALMNHTRMEVEIAIEGNKVRSKAAMVAIANATMYGTGLKINPDGDLTDGLFEVVLVKDYSYLEILKIWFTKIPLNPKKIEVFQTRELRITSKHKAHFQVDGEYLGEVNKVVAAIMPAAINVIAGAAYGEKQP